MTDIPPPLHSTAQAIYGTYEQRANKKQAREYLGWSEIGAECERQLWYGFRWAWHNRIDGRLARLFDSGHREEARLIKDLRDIGCTVWDRDDDGNQFAVQSHGAHSRGHVDAVVTGLPEAPKTAHVFDAKTISRKWMDKLQKDGFEKTFPKYHAQAHGYMGKLLLKRAMFIFVCKDDDEIYTERIEFDQRVFDYYEGRALRIIKAASPPARLSNDPAWYQCKFCRFHSICHGTDVALVNCRTCMHSTADTENGGWVCERERKEITKTPRDGCDDHRFIPMLLENIADVVDGHAAANRVNYRNKATGKSFVNGSGQMHLSSNEIHLVADKKMLGEERTDKTLRELRKEFGAEFCG